MAKWRRGEADDFPWLGWWLEMLRGHHAAGRTCRRARVVSEPLSDYQRWTISHAQAFVDAGEDIRYVNRPRLTEVFLPGSGDFYVFDDEVVLFPALCRGRHQCLLRDRRRTRTVRACAGAFEDV
jgi:hypothetical protein